ncbi:Reverse transcriptase [Phytophthora palmivora]|uniref:Reverse transcriptase n=1 Tax=Phytophthora palmivora TaxID=4796 RepID=A0A2P4XU82_9STRA|nr:Reverse transcriptase [Phytophthora palmivora]
MSRPVEEQSCVFDGVSGRQVKEGAVHLEALPEVSTLLNLEELPMKDFLAELKAGNIAEMPETFPEDLNSSSATDEDVLERFTKQRAARDTLNLLDPCRHQNVFNSIIASLRYAPVLALADERKYFSVVFDDPDYAISCVVLQKDDEGRERVIPFRSRQLKTEHTFLGPRLFVVYTDHAFLRIVTNSPNLSKRMARWVSFLAEYNFHVEYKPGKLNVLADVFSSRPDYVSHRLDYELAHVSRVTTDLYDRIRLAYQEDENYTPLVQFLSDGKDAKVDRLSPRQRAQLHCYELADGLLHYRVDPGDHPRVVVPNNEDLKYDILLAHDAPMSGRLGRE